jgi:cell division GTPase FtsZ
MENEGNVACLAKLYLQISKEGQDRMDNMAHTMLSIQNSGNSFISDHNDKVKFVSQVYPQISRQGQEYLDTMAHAMLRIQGVGDSGENQ